MKRWTFSFLFALALGSGLLASCDLRVLNDEAAITQDAVNTANGTVLAAAGMLKNGFAAHQEIGWTSALIGEQELSPNRQNQTFVFAVRIANESIVAADNSQNATVVRGIYTALSLADVVEKGVASNTFSTNAAADAKAKALLTANVLFMRGLLYGDLAKFYVNTLEAKTGATLAPDAAKQRAIDLLTQAQQKWQEYYSNTATAPISVAGLVGVRAGATAGTFVPDSAAVRKFVNSYIAVLHFDMGTKPQATPYLANGYVAADQGLEVSYPVQNALTGAAIYPTVRNYVAFGGLNSYSASFIANRIPADTSRRAPSAWYLAATANNIDYFYPGTGRYPLVSWQEVALMRAQLGAQDSIQVKAAVLQSWRIAAALATTLASDASITLDRISRYEYAGRGRRWSAVGSYQRWPLANELNVSN